MEGEARFRALMARVLSGEATAAQELLDEYGSALLCAVRSRLPRELRSKFDSTDFTQDVWASFFAELPHQQSFDNPEALVAFLVSLARNKVAETVRSRLQGRKYSVKREQSLDDATAGDPEKLTSRQRTASETAMSREEWEQFLKSQPLAYRRILILLRDGHKPEEVARELGISERTVRRLLDKLSPGQTP